MELLEEFRKALEGDSEVNPFDFKTLIPYNADDETVSAIFGTLPNSASIIRRVNELLRENGTGGAYIVPDQKNAIGTEMATSLAKRYALSLKDLLRTHGNLDEANEINTDNVQIFSSNEDFLRAADDPSLDPCEAYEELRLIVRDELKKITKGQFALSEAVLGLTNYPQISHHILAPAMKLNLDTQPYYELWKGGYDVNFLRGKLLLLVASI
jgi:hypothetical protein